MYFSVTINVRTNWAWQAHFIRDAHNDRALYTKQKLLPASYSFTFISNTNFNNSVYKYRH